jgi:hypothetical protein
MVTLQNGNVTKLYVLQNGTVTKRYALQNGTRYKTVRVTKRYVLQNGALQNGHRHRRVRYKTVTVTERYVTKWYMKNGLLHNATVLCFEQVNRSSNNLLEIYFTGKDKK